MINTESTSPAPTNSLNTRQSQAVEATEGRVRVVAGAGSGKTRVLAHRFAYLVNDIGVSPANVLCMTFTNKAAQEMKRRISAMTDRGNVNDFICTIHGFCVKFLRREIYRIGYPKSFAIIDEDDGKQLAKQAMAEFGIDRRKTTAERFLSSVAAFKGYDPEGYISAHLLPGAPQEASDAIIRYIKLQLKQYCLDYDDLIYFTIYILDRFADARKYWTEKLNYIMVDEVQDCTGDDWKLLERLAAYHGNLFVVGDPDQAIYEWRGANPKIFVKFQADTDVTLDRNYRSTPDILNVANTIISRNENRVPKELYTTRLNERQPEWHHFKTEAEESEFVASTIDGALQAGAEAGEFAVLYRASHLSRRMEQELLRRKVPYTVWGGVRFFERMEIKDAIAYLNLVARGDDASLRRVINVPSRRFGKSTLECLTELAESDGITLLEALQRHIDNRKFARTGAPALLELLVSAKTLMNQLSVSELADYVLRQSGLTDYYRTDTEEERLENLSELINSMKEFESRQDEDSDRTLEAYLQEAMLYSNVDVKPDSGRVKLMTIHQAKGLEFPTVFIVGLTEGIFPSHRTIRERRKDGEEEERRLMYVAATRAEDMLYLTESEGYMNDTGALKFPSRYLTEVGEGMLLRVGEPDPALLEGTSRMVSMLNQELGEGSDGPMKPGTRVSHKVFGEGTIESYDAANRSYKVNFGSKGVRNLLPHVLTPL